MNRGCGLPPGEEAHRLRVQVIGRGEDVLRLKKRLKCAAGALGVRLTIEHLPDEIRAAELGARRGPLVLAAGRVIADGPEPVELIQERLARLVPHAARSPAASTEKV